ncbi:MAG: response regulator, partial [Acetatifactor sp.]
HMMPEMDGIETLQNMKALPDNPNRGTPVIMLTANAIVGAKEEYMEAGFTDYLTKPIQETALLEMLLKYLPEEFICESKEIENSEDMVQSEPEEQIEESEREQMRQLEKLEGLDVQTGLSYCMNEEEFYVEILKEYLKTDKASKIEQFFAEEDWNNYRTVVHALKSTSLTIGAVHLSEEAKALEMAAKEGDVDYIRSHHKDVLEEYIRLTERMKEILEDGAQV